MGTEIVEHVGGAVVGESANQTSHGGLFQRLLESAVAESPIPFIGSSPGPIPNANSSEFAPIAYMYVEKVWKEKPTAADQRALIWGQAIGAFYNNGASGGVPLAEPGDAGAAAGTTTPQ